MKPIVIFLTSIFIILSLTCGGPLVPSQVATEQFLDLPFSPKKIPDCVVWLDGNDPIGTNPLEIKNFFVEDLSISKWIDKSGKGNDIVQITTNDQPKIKGNSLNGNSGVFFDVSDGMASTNPVSGWSVGIAAPKSIYLIVKFKDFLAGSNNVVFVIGDGVINCGQFIFGYFDAFPGNNFGIDSGGSGQYVGFLPYNLILEAPYLINYRYDGGNFLSGTSSINQTNTTITSYGYPGGPPPPQLTAGIISVGNLGSTFSQSVMYEIIVYDRKLTDDEDAKVLGYLTQKWGL